MAIANKDDEVQFDNINDLFGADLDDLVDLAAFEVPPPGTYVLRVTAGTKEINDTPAVELKFAVQETVELKVQDPEDKKYRAPVKEGTEFGIAFMLNNNISIGRLKEFLIPFAEAFNEKGPGAVGRLVQDRIKEVVIAATITNRPDKNDPERIYAGIKNIQVS